MAYTISNVIEQWFHQLPFKVFAAQDQHVASTEAALWSQTHAFLVNNGFASWKHNGTLQKQVELQRSNLKRRLFSVCCDDLYWYPLRLSGRLCYQLFAYFIRKHTECSAAFDLSSMFSQPIRCNLMHSSCNISSAYYICPDTHGNY